QLVRQRAARRHQAHPAGGRQLIAWIRRSTPRSTTPAQRHRATAPQRLTPGVEQLAPYAQLSRQGAHVLASLHPTEHFQLELAAKDTRCRLGHQLSSRELSPLSVSHCRGALHYSDPIFLTLTPFSF